jgi:hypothetical protein
VVYVQTPEKFISSKSSLQNFEINKR